MHTCTNCGSSNLMSVQMTLKGGAVAFANCRRCEHRWWTDGEQGGAIHLTQVLDRAA